MASPRSLRGQRWPSPLSETTTKSKAEESRRSPTWTPDSDKLNSWGCSNLSIIRIWWVRAAKYRRKDQWIRTGSPPSGALLRQQKWDQCITIWARCQATTKATTAAPKAPCRQQCHRACWILIESSKIITSVSITSRMPTKTCTIQWSSGRRHLSKCKTTPMPNYRWPTWWVCIGKSSFWRRNP